MRGLQILTSLLLLAAFCKADDSEEEKHKMLEAASVECAEEQGLTKEEVENIPKMICTGEELDKKFSCHTACFYKKLGVMKDGEVDVDGIKEALLSKMRHEEIRAKLEGKLDPCKAESDGIADECDKAIGFTKCVFADTEFCKKISS